jgi:hypothetical protein
MAAKYEVPRVWYLIRIGTSATDEHGHKQISKRAEVSTVFNIRVSFVFICGKAS